LKVFVAQQQQRKIFKLSLFILPFVWCGTIIPAFGMPPDGAESASCSPSPVSARA
jgi:hypothetical protein